MTENEYRELIEIFLKKTVPSQNCSEGELARAIKYSLCGGGKRIRPILTLEFCRLCGGNIKAALPFACAVEMVHTYSLIHDDLPCMDDDDTRRGRASNHIVFGEDIALLAGDALLSLAFETMLSPRSIFLCSPERAARAAYILARNSGATGMAGGQVIDLQHEGKPITAALLEEMDEKKTGALIMAAAQMGCIIAGAGEKEIAAAGAYSKALGLAFQIVDDILDVTADESELGKPVGSDLANRKSTYVSLLGMERSKALARELTDHAIAALSVFSGDTVFLAGLAENLFSRRK